MGCSAAYSLPKMCKDRIVLIDRYGVGNEYSSSNDINRVFRYSYGRDEIYTKMAVESFKLWKMLEEESDNQLMITTGLLMVNGEDESANRFNKTSYETLERLRLGAGVLQGHDLKLRFPQFTAGSGYFDQHGGILLASKALETFRHLAEASRVKFLRAQARQISPNNDHDGVRILLDTGESINTGKVVIATGPWSNSLLKPELPRMIPTRQQLIYFHPRTKLQDYRPSSFPVFFTDQHYGLPAAGIDAVKVSPKELKEKADPETAKRIVDDDQVNSCRDVCRKYIPSLSDSKVVHSKICLYDMTENTDFVIDKDPENTNLVYGYGFSGHGFKFAPLIGRFLAELALDREITGFNIDRFTAVRSRRTGQPAGQLGKS